MEFSWWLSAQTASITIRLEKEISLIWRASLAMSAEEMITVGTRPSCRVMRGPYLLESSVKETCGLVPRLKRFPKIGTVGGPGGNVRGCESLLFFAFERIRWIAIHARRRYNTKLRLAGLWLHTPYLNSTTQIGMIQ